GLTAILYLVFQIGVAGVPAIHWARQADTIRVPVDQIKCLRCRALEIVITTYRQIRSFARSVPNVNANSFPGSMPPCPIVASRSAIDASSRSSPISPESEKSSIVVRSVTLARLSLRFAASTPAAQLSIVPPTQKPSE